MTFGSMFDTAWNNASDFSRATAASVAAGATDAARWTRQKVEDGERDLKAASMAIKNETLAAADQIKKITIQTAHHVETSVSETVQKVKDKSLQAADWSRNKVKSYAEQAKSTYENVKEEFSNAVAGSVQAACNSEKFIDAENFVYQKGAGSATSLYGSVNKIVSAEKVNVEFTDESFKQWTGGLSIESSISIYEDHTGETISREMIKDLFTDPDKAKKILVENKNIHTVYRQILNNNMPDTPTEAVKSGEWVELSTGKAVFHGSLFHGNRKFVSKDGHREIIFGPDGKIDSRTEFKGTFNFFSPTEYPVSHISADVDPYVKHGN